MLRKGTEELEQTGTIIKFGIGQNFLFGCGVCVIVLSIINILVLKKYGDSIGKCMPGYIQSATTLIDVFLQTLLLISLPNFNFVFNNKFYYFCYICLIFSNVFWGIYDIW